MADALGQEAGTIQAFAFAHRFCSLFDGFDEIAYFAHSTGTIASNCLAELPKTELHVVEVGNGFAQLDGDVGEHVLEFSEGKAGKV